MKKFITIKQWDEITGKQKGTLFDSGFKRDWRMSIGDMIEFLNGDIDDVIFHSPSSWTIIVNKEFYDEELCDALWEAVKFKLKQL